MEGFPSGQREQTVNLSSMTSVVRIHHLPPKQKEIPKGMSFFCFGGRWLWIRKVALRNSPVGCFNHRGFAAAKRIHHRTGRHAPNPKGRPDCSIAKSTCTGVCNDLLPLATLSRRGAQCAPGQREIIRFVGEHSDSLRAAYGGCSLDAHCGGCVRPTGYMVQNHVSQQTIAPVSSLDKTGASVYNTDIRTALTCQVRSFPEQV